MMFRERGNDINENTFSHSIALVSRERGNENTHSDSKFALLDDVSRERKLKNTHTRHPQILKIQKV